MAEVPSGLNVPVDVSMEIHEDTLSYLLTWSPGRITGTSFDCAECNELIFLTTSMQNLSTYLK